MKKVETGLPDVQNRGDARGISIDRVGITNVYFPIKVKVKTNHGAKYVPVSARTKLFVGLPKDYKGVNMSRFAESLVEFKDRFISYDTLSDLLHLLRTKLKSEDAYARFEFDYYIDKVAPVSRKVAPQAYRCAFTGISRNGDYEFILEVNVVAASLCPCSREMSLFTNLKNELPETFSRLAEERSVPSGKVTQVKLGDIIGMGAHNQRSIIRVELVPKQGQMIWIEDIVSLIEKEASAPTYPILKRPDEKFVTELAYNNPKFSEDITRDVQMALEKVAAIDSWALRVYNEESIHPFDVCCYQQSANWKH